jgi:hypothetical protein
VAARLNLRNVLINQNVILAYFFQSSEHGTVQNFRRVPIPKNVIKNLAHLASVADTDTDSHGSALK